MKRTETVTITYQLSHELKQNGGGSKIVCELLDPATLQNAVKSTGGSKSTNSRDSGGCYVHGSNISFFESNKVETGERYFLLDDMSKGWVRRSLRHEGTPATCFRGA